MVRNPATTARRKTAFVGAAKRMTDADYARVAARLFVDVACIKAVAEVESSGSGFLADKRPKILFESRWFHKLTDGRHDAKHGDISTPRWERNYAGGAGEYDRLAKAVALDRAAALKSASWGKFQILGVNHRVSGYDDVESFVAAMMESEGSHLDAFAGFVIGNRLDDELRDRDWHAFARGYNGPRYAENRYAERMAEAFAAHSEGWMVPTVAEIQTALNRFGATLTVDGKTGPNTRNAVRAFQRDAGLSTDGVAGPKTLAALGLGPAHDPIAFV